MPDFLLHDVYCRTDDKRNQLAWQRYWWGYDDEEFNLYVEVKGNMTKADEQKIRRFSYPILIVGNIPKGNSIFDFFYDICQYPNGGAVYFFNFSTIDDDDYLALPCISKRGRFLIGGSNYYEFIDEKATVIAYNRARQARFEHGETPDDTDSAKPFDLLLAPNDTPIDILQVAGHTQYFVKAARLFSAITGKDVSISDQHPIIQAADAINVTAYRFATQRLSGNESFGKKAFYFTVDDTPKVLLQYAEHLPSVKGFTSFQQLKKAAFDLHKWFVNEVIPKYGKVE